MLGFNGLGVDAIGEAPEDRFHLGGDATAALDWEVRIYAATHEYISFPLDVPADQQFKGTLEKAFRIDRSIISTSIGEYITVGLGELRINNYEGDYDFLVRDITPLGQRVVIRHGDRKRPLSESRIIFDGFMTSHQPDRNGVVFALRDAGHRLDVPASPNTYLGTGGTEGSADLEGKRKPKWFGHVLNVTPPLVIPASLAYQLNDGQIETVTNVYVRGVAQLLDADYASVTLMNAASLSIGEYATCLAAGWIRIAVAGGSEVGQVTCDFSGDKTGGVFVDTTASIVRRIMAIATDIEDPTELSEATFDEVDMLQPAPVGYGIPVGDERTAAAAVGDMMRNIGGWCGARRSGRFEVRRFEEPIDPPVARYTDEDIKNLGVAGLPVDVSPPPWRLLVGYARNYTVQDTDLAGSVSDSRRAFLKEELRYGVAEDNDIRLDFPPGHEIVKELGLFQNQSDAETEAARQLALYGPGRALYVISLAAKQYIHELGQVIHVTFPRFDLTEGKLLRIVKLTEDDREGVEIVAFG